ncbi:MAG: TonB-dependent receptor [Candidatus Schekmanbacteria bacterium]|nr:TonB-dependent receptor [Candidatus Schekmanbacteria bacterium]
MVRLLAVPLAILLLCPRLAYADDNKEVITCEDIVKGKPATLMELLKKRVGVGDSAGALTLRGIPNVAVYINGFPASGVVTVIEGIKPEDVEQIEIYRGAASARFGADALGGAIVITTRKGNQKFGLDLIQGYNSFDSRYTRAIASGGLGEYNLRLSLEDSRTNKIYNIDKDNCPFSYLLPVEESYSTKREGELKTGYKNGWLDAGLSLDYREDTYHWGRPNYYREDTGFSPELLVNINTGGFKLSTTCGYQKKNIELIRDKGGVDEEGLSPYMKIMGDYDTANAEMQAEIAGFNLGLVYGMDDEVQLQKDYSTDQLIFKLKDKIERMAVFAVYSISFPQTRLGKEVSLELSGRYDRYRYYNISMYSADAYSSGEPIIKESFNPKLALKWVPGWNGWGSEAVAFKASAGTGFIPPSPADLYYKEIGETYQYLPNPDLKPERSLTLDAGVEGVFPQGFKTGLTFYYTRWFDKMESITTPGTPSITQTQNIGESESKGLEASLDKEIMEGLNAALNYTLTLTRITQSADSTILDHELPHSPRHRLNFMLSYVGIKDLTVNTSLRYESSQFTDLKNIVRDEEGYKWEKDGYYVVDISLVKKLKFMDIPLDLTLAVDNLLDEHYQKGFFQRDPGRVIRGEVALRF